MRSLLRQFHSLQPRGRRPSASCYPQYKRLHVYRANNGYVNTENDNYTCNFEDASIQRYAASILLVPARTTLRKPTQIKLWIEI